MTQIISLIYIEIPTAGTVLVNRSPGQKTIIGANIMLDLQRLKALFSAFPGENKISVRGTCFDCGCPVEIEINKTSGGYGFLGGVLAETGMRSYIMKCPICYAIDSDFNERNGRCRYRIDEFKKNELYIDTLRAFHPKAKRTQLNHINTGERSMSKAN